MSASVYLSCSQNARSVAGGTVRLTLDTRSAGGKPAEPHGDMLIVAKASMPLVAIRQTEVEDSGNDATV